MYDCPLPCVVDTYMPNLSVSQFTLKSDVGDLARQLNITGTDEAKEKSIRYDYSFLQKRFLISKIG